MNLANRIRRARKHVGLSQAALAKHLGVHRSCVGHWEGVSNANPRHDRLADVARICVVSYEWPATGRGPVKPGHDPLDHIPAAARVSIDDPQALRLLGAWEAMSSHSRVALLGLVEELAALRQPRRRRGIEVSRVLAGR